jgi:hypothetical protein
MFIQSRAPQPVGKLLRFEVRLDEGQRILGGQAKVIWVREYDAANPRQVHGMGVKFLDLDPASWRLVERILEHKQQQNAAPAGDRRRSPTMEVHALADEADPPEADEPTETAEPPQAAASGDLQEPLGASTLEPSAPSEEHDSPAGGNGVDVSVDVAEQALQELLREAGISEERVAAVATRVQQEPPRLQDMPKLAELTVPAELPALELQQIRQILDAGLGDRRAARVAEPPGGPALSARSAPATRDHPEAQPEHAGEPEEGAKPPDGPESESSGDDQDLPIALDAQQGSSPTMDGRVTQEAPPAEEQLQALRRSDAHDNSQLGSAGAEREVDEATGPAPGEEHPPEYRDDDLTPICSVDELLGAPPSQRAGEEEGADLASWKDELPESDEVFDEEEPTNIALDDDALEVVEEAGDPEPAEPPPSPPWPPQKKFDPSLLQAAAHVAQDLSPDEARQDFDLSEALSSGEFDEVFDKPQGRANRDGVQEPPSDGGWKSLRTATEFLDHGSSSVLKDMAGQSGRLPEATPEGEDPAEEVGFDEQAETAIGLESSRDGTDAGLDISPLDELEEVTTEPVLEDTGPAAESLSREVLEEMANEPDEFGLDDFAPADAALSNEGGVWSEDEEGTEIGAVPNFDLHVPLRPPSEGLIEGDPDLDDDIFESLAVLDEQAKPPPPDATGPALAEPTSQSDDEVPSLDDLASTTPQVPTLDDLAAEAPREPGGSAADAPAQPDETEESGAASAESSGEDRRKRSGLFGRWFKKKG